MDVRRCDVCAVVNAEDLDGAVRSIGRNRFMLLTVLMCARAVSREDDGETSRHGGVNEGGGCAWSVEQAR
jgi:hypothetical protein